MQTTVGWSLRRTVEPITLCLINQKGGCGKSSTCFHLAGTLAVAGYSVLLVDADPQGSLSQGFLGSTAVERLPAHQTLAGLFDESHGFARHGSLICSTNVEGVSLVPANHHLAPFNETRPERTRMRQFVLRDFLQGQRGFDIVLIDCPPNLYQCSWNAMLASTHVLIPVPPEDFGAQGLRAVHQAISEARQLNPALQLLGHLVTRVDRRLLIHRSYIDGLRELYGPQVLSTQIPELSAFKVALACRLPVECYQPNGQAAAALRSLKDELGTRLGTQRQRQLAV